MTVPEDTQMSVKRERQVWRWVLQRARDWIINRLRGRRSHADLVHADADGPLLETVPAATSEMMVERIARDERRAAVCEALDILRQAQYKAPPQRDPLAQTLFPKLTRQEAGLQVPRWITGRRIRIGQDEVSLDRLALLIVFILVGTYGLLALQYVRTQTVADRNELAVALVTAKDVAPLRLAAASGVPSAANGTYWDELAQTSQS